jgi:hypothetical protein
MSTGFAYPESEESSPNPSPTSMISILLVLSFGTEFFQVGSSGFPTKSLTASPILYTYHKFAHLILQDLVTYTKF